MSKPCNQTTTTDNPWATETPEWQKYEDQRALAKTTSEDRLQTRETMLIGLMKPTAKEEYDETP